jgi:tetratricopeptide (TPR) repeat protein
MQRFTSLAIHSPSVSPILSRKVAKNASSPLLHQRPFISAPTQEEKPASFLSTANALSDLAFQYHTEGKTEPAKFLAQQSLEMSHKFGIDTPKTNAAKMMTNSFGTAPSLVQDMGIFQKNKGATTEKELGQLSTQMQKLAYLSLERGEFDKAKNTVQQALTISERLLGIRHPAVKQCDETFKNINYLIFEKQIELEAKKMATC